MSTAFQLPPLPSVRWTDEDMRYARLSTDAPRMPWDAFLRREFVWRQGEHVALIGATGQGKTTMLMKLLPLHPYRVVLATKRRDPTMDKLIRDGDYLKMTHWRRLDPRNTPRRVVWPNAASIGQMKDLQQEVFQDVFERVYAEGGWTVAIDEVWWYTNILNLGLHIRVLLLQGRSNNLSLILSTQRPKDVPTEIYSQSTHIMFWRDNDRLNLDRISEINSRDSALVREVVRNLEDNQVLYVNTRTGRMVRTHIPKIALAA